MDLLDGLHWYCIETVGDDDTSFRSIHIAKKVQKYTGGRGLKNLFSRPIS